MSAAYEVVRQVPARFVKGIADGILRAEGGVIRNLDTGKVVGHLEIGGTDSLARIKDALPQLDKRLGNVSGLLQASVVLQGINLAVSVVGFVVVCRKLNAIAAKLEAMQDQIAQVLEGQRREEFMFELERLANLDADLKSLAQGLRVDDEHMVRNVLTMLNRSVAFQRRLAVHLLHDPMRIYHAPQALELAMDLAISSTFAAARAWALQGQTDEAVLEIKELEAWHGSQLQRLEEPRLSQDNRLALLPDTAREEMKILLKKHRDIPPAIRFNQTYYTFCRDNGIDLRDLPPRTDEEPVAILVTKNRRVA